MFLLFLITVHLNARIPEKLVFWTVSYGPYKLEQHYFVEAFYSSNSDLPLQKTKQYF